jgi:hypothetical protein
MIMNAVSTLALADYSLYIRSRLKKHLPISPK